MLLLKATVTAVLLAVLLLRVDISTVFATFARFRLETWLSNFALFLAATVIAALRWKTLIPHHSFPKLLRLNFIAQYYSTLLPGQVAGEVVKAFRLGRGKPDAGQIAASVVLDRITGLIGLIAVGIGGAIFTSSAIDDRLVAVLAAVMVVIFAALYCLKLPGWLRLVRRMAGRLGRFEARTLGLIDEWKVYLDAPGVLLLSTAVGAAFQLIAVWINLRFARELGIGIAFADWCLIFGVISVVTALPFTVAGVGLREGSFVGALALFGVAAEPALALSFAVFILLIAGAAIGGVLEWTRRPADQPVEAPAS